MKSFSSKIDELNKKNMYPFHMPGHKRRMKLGNPYSIDITEIDGYDNLHSPEGMIRELEECICGLYNRKNSTVDNTCRAEKSYVLVNGSTCGILSAISAVTKYGDEILMARNSHKSAYNAICIRGLRADYVYPEYILEPGMNSAILPESIRRMLFYGKNNMEEKPHDKKNAIIHNESQDKDVNLKIKKKYAAVYITSPTYEGIVSNIREISDIVHEYGAVLIVDEAHGAHFGLAEGFPDSAIENGADIVIQSIHKTLMGMTQTAVLHISSEAVSKRRVDTEKLEYYLRAYQTSSPSYVLMSSVDACVRMLENDEERKVLFDGYKKKLDLIHKKSKMWKDMHIFDPEEMDNVDKSSVFDFDRGKLVIYSRSGRLTGKEIYDILRERYSIQPEMSLGGYCLAMTSCMDSVEGFERLSAALEELDMELVDVKNENSNRDGIEKQHAGGGMNDKKIHSAEAWTQGQQHVSTAFTVAQAFDMEKSMAKLEEGAVAGEYVYVYPPGIPFIVPGEIVTKEVICDIIKAKVSGYEVHGVIFNEAVPYMKVLDCVE